MGTLTLHRNETKRATAKARSGSKANLGISTATSATSASLMGVHTSALAYGTSIKSIADYVPDIRLKSLFFRFTIPGKKLLKSDSLYDVMTTDSTQIQLTLTSEQFALNPSPSLYIDAIWPAENMEIRNLIYNFKNATASADVQGAGGAGFIPFEGSAKEAITTLLTDALKGTPAAAPGYNPFADEDLVTTLHAIQANIEGTAGSQPAVPSKPVATSQVAANRESRVVGKSAGSSAVLPKPVTTYRVTPGPMEAPIKKSDIASQSLSAVTTYGTTPVPSKPPIETSEVGGLSVGATFTLNTGVERESDGGGIRIPGGSECTLTISSAGSLADILKEDSKKGITSQINSIKLSCDSITLMRKGKPIAKLQELKFTKGGKVSVDKVTLLGDLEVASDVERLGWLVLLTSLFASKGAPLQTAVKMAGSRRDPTHVVHDAATAKIEQSLSQAIAALVMQNRYVIPGIDLAEALGLIAPIPKPLKN